MSCNTPTQNWLGSLKDHEEYSDEDILIQVMKNNNSHQDTTELEYRIRIFPVKKMQSLPVLSDVKWLRMDSCFYLQSGNSIYQPAFIEPVANGINNSHEYLLVFKIQSEMTRQNLDLVYIDKYSNNKKRFLSLNEK